MIEVTPAQIIHSDAAVQQSEAKDLLRLCHAYLRGIEINTPQGSYLLDRDTLARMINLYLNEQTEERKEFE